MPGKIYDAKITYESVEKIMLMTVKISLQNWNLAKRNKQKS